jgi:alcohol dehydrogenase
MKALVYQGPQDIRCESIPDATPVDSNGAVVRVTRAGICGSDLHIYAGHGFSPQTGYAVGHEAVGEVVETGNGVTRFRAGDRVLVPGSTGCTTCVRCLQGEVFFCENGRAGCYGLSHQLEGSQAEAVAVPSADTGLVGIPPSMTDEQALLLTDNLPTAWLGARKAGILPGDVVLVIGLGPVGIGVIQSAFAMGASKVLALDLVAARREHAAKLGAIPIDPDTASTEVREHSDGRGPARVIEAVGSDATIRLACELCRPGGSVSVVGVNQNPSMEFNMALTQAKNLTFAISLCSVQAELKALLPLVESGRIDPSVVVTHRMGLSEGAEAYRQFAAREGNVLKVVLDPSR